MAHGIDDHLRERISRTLDDALDLDTLSQVEGQDIFTERAVDLAIAYARPYVRWSTDDHGDLRRLFRYGDLQSHQKAHLTKIGRQIGGWIIVRHAPSRLDLPYIYPELRPDGKVKTGPPVRHWHGFDASVLADKDEWMASKALRQGLILTGRDGWPADPYTAEQSDHVGREYEPNPDPGRFPNAYGDERVYYGGHSGINVNEVHYHQHLPKYVFLPNAKHSCWHDHSVFDGKPDKFLKGHLREHHDADHGGRHQHRVKDCVLPHTKYAPCLSRDPGMAKRIDVHPLAEDLITERPVVFFVIEGCLKADAILSAGEAVFSVPAVGQWRAPELDQFVYAYGLHDKHVVIVPDSDWADKPTVLRQARECQEYLGHLGVAAMIAAPPGDQKVGVDDHLYAGRSLGDLHVITYEPDPMIAAYVDGFDSVRLDARKNALKVIRALAIRADEDGKISMSNRAIGRLVGRNKATVDAALRRLEEHGALTRHGEHIEISPPYRATISEPKKLGEVLDRLT